jgi:hypothetical protein
MCAFSGKNGRVPFDFSKVCALKGLLFIEELPCKTLIYPVCLSPGASSATMLIFILPAAFYLRLVKKEPLRSPQKVGVSKTCNVSPKTVDLQVLKSNQKIYMAQRSETMNKNQQSKVSWKSKRVQAAGVQGKRCRLQLHYPCEITKKELSFLPESLNHVNILVIFVRFARTNSCSCPLPYPIVP